MKNALGDFGSENLPDALTNPDFVGAMSQQGAHVLGHDALAGGSIITGMIWGAFTALIIDHKFTNAGYFTLVAAILTSVGVLHSHSLHTPELNQITIGYLLMSAFLFIYPKVGTVESLIVENDRPVD